MPDWSVGPSTEKTQSLLLHGLLHASTPISRADVRQIQWMQARSVSVPLCEGNNTQRPSLLSRRFWLHVQPARVPPPPQPDYVTSCSVL